MSKLAPDLMYEAPLHPVCYHGIAREVLHQLQRVKGTAEGLDELLKIRFDKVRPELGRKIQAAGQVSPFDIHDHIAAGLLCKLSHVRIQVSAVAGASCTGEDDAFHGRQDLPVRLKDRCFRIAAFN